MRVTLVREQPSTERRDARSEGSRGGLWMSSNKVGVSLSPSYPTEEDRSCHALGTSLRTC